MSTQGTKQGDNLSPNYFSMYLNPFISELKAYGLGVGIDEDVIPVLCICAFCLFIILSQITVD